MSTSATTYPESPIRQYLIEPSALSRPLSAAEQDKLAEWLASPRLPEATMTMEEFDGLCCALAVGPGLPPPARVWLPLLFGGAPLPAWGEAEGKLFFTLVLRHMNAVRAALSRPARELTDESVYQPWVYEIEESQRILPPQLDDEGERQGAWLGRWWAGGFLAGVDALEPAWDPLLNDDEVGGLIIPFEILEHGYDEDDPEAPFDEEALMSECVVAAYEMNAWWAPKRPVRRAVPHKSAARKTARRPR